MFEDFHLNKYRHVKLTESFCKLQFMVYTKPYLFVEGDNWFFMPYVLALFRYFIFTSTDLEDWAQDPEGFHHEQDMIQWIEKLRPCAEALYLTLFENYRQVLGGNLCVCDLGIFPVSMLRCHASDMHLCFSKDIYCF